MGYSEYLSNIGRLSTMSLFELLEIYGVDYTELRSGLVEFSDLERRDLETQEILANLGFIFPDLYHVLFSAYSRSDFCFNALDLSGYRDLGLTELEFEKLSLDLRGRLLSSLNDFISRVLVESSRLMEEILDTDIYVDNSRRMYKLRNIVDISSDYFNPRYLFRLGINKDLSRNILVRYKLDVIPISLLKLKHPIYNYKRYGNTGFCYNYELLTNYKGAVKYNSLIEKVYHSLYEDICMEGFNLIKSEMMRYDLYSSNEEMKDIIEKQIKEHFFYISRIRFMDSDSGFLIMKSLMDYAIGRMDIFVETGITRFDRELRSIFEEITRDSGDFINNLRETGLLYESVSDFRNFIFNFIKSKVYLSGLFDNFDEPSEYEDVYKHEILRRRYYGIAEDTPVLSSAGLEIEAPVVGYKFCSEYFGRLFEFIEGVEYSHLFSSDELDLDWARGYMKRARDCIVKLIGYEERYLLGKSESRFGPYSDFMTKLIADHNEYYDNRYNDGTGTGDKYIRLPVELSLAMTNTFFANLCIFSREGSSAQSFEQVIELLFTIMNRMKEASYMEDVCVSILRDNKGDLGRNLCKGLQDIKGSVMERELILLNLNKLAHNNGLGHVELYNFDLNILKNNLGYEIVDFYLKLKNIKDSLSGDEISILIEKGFITDEDIRLLKEILNKGINFAIDKFYTSDLSNQESRDLLLRLKNKLSMIVQSSSVMKFYPLAEKKDENLFKINHKLDYEGKRYRFRVLEDYDPYHFQVGADTNCCQYFGGVGQGAAIDSFINPLAGVVLLEAYNKDINDYELLCQSYFHYVPEDNGIILDNIERAGRADRHYGKNLITSLYKIYGDELLGRGFRYVYCGKECTKILNFAEFEERNTEIFVKDPRHFEVDRKTDYSVYNDFFKSDEFLVFGEKL